MRKNGFTFAEMLVVVAIIALMMTIMLPRLTFQQKGAGLKGAATQVMSALRAARRLAITNRNVYAVAFDLSTIPGRFVRLRYTGTLPPTNWNAWTPDEELQQLHNNIAIVALSTPGSATLDVKRTDDVDLDGDDEVGGAQELPSNLSVYNPELDPATGLPGRNGIVNPILRLVKFNPTGTADSAVIYLWNSTEQRVPLPNPTSAQTSSKLDLLGLPPGLSIRTPINNQAAYFTVQSVDSPMDVLYYTIVVNPVTGAVTVYDYAWGSGGISGSDKEWDRKKDGA